MQVHERVGGKTLGIRVGSFFPSPTTEFSGRRQGAAHDFTYDMMLRVCTNRQDTAVADADPC